MWNSVGRSNSFQIWFSPSFKLNITQHYFYFLAKVIKSQRKSRYFYCWVYVRWFSINPPKKHIKTPNKRLLKISNFTGHFNEFQNEQRIWSFCMAKNKVCLKSPGHVNTLLSINEEKLNYYISILSH